MKLFIIIFISFGVGANTLSVVKANNMQVSRYIIPQMKSILRDFSAFENIIDPKINELKSYKKRTHTH